MSLFFETVIKNVANIVLNNIKNVAKIRRNILNNVAKDVYNIKKKTKSGV